MNNFLNNLLHFYRLIVEPSGKNRCIGFGNPKYYVLYNDGNRSVRMHYDVCCDYADMFGGVVKKISKVKLYE